MSIPLTAILVGAGNRGCEVYGQYALTHSKQIRFVGVAEPNDVRRQRFANAHGIRGEGQFSKWEDLLSLPRFADVALVCTLDHLHTAPACAALEAGYDVLLEKPMATTVDDCLRLVRTAERSGRLLQICHVLRYTPFFSTLHDIVHSGRLGEIVTVEHRENVSYWHMAHSYVRGNWRRSGLECPMILAKCCHDLDILYWNLGPCTRLSSFGSLVHFRPQNAPESAPERCTYGCPAADRCPWYAPLLYLELIPLLREARCSSTRLEQLGAYLALEHPALAHLLKSLLPGYARALDYQGWPISVISDEPSPEARRQALESGPYGRCVYRCDNDVVDHQVVSMQLESGASAVLVMHGHSYREGRTMRYDGTRASLIAWYYLGDQGLRIHDHNSGEVEIVRSTQGRLGASGHGGGDESLLEAFLQAVRDPGRALTTSRSSLESHLLAFAAEEARTRGSVVAMHRYRRLLESA